MNAKKCSASEIMSRLDALGLDYEKQGQQINVDPDGSGKHPLKLSPRRGLYTDVRIPAGVKGHGGQIVWLLDNMERQANPHQKPTRIPTPAAPAAPIPDSLRKLVNDDLARSGLTLADIHGAAVVGADAMKSVKKQDDIDAEDALCDGSDYDPDDEDEDEDTILTLSGADREAAGGYTIPYFKLDGKAVRDHGKPFQRIRLVGRVDDTVPRYRSPYKSDNHVFIPQGLRGLLDSITRRRSVLSDTDVLVITEGEKKAVKAVKSGIPCIALPGITMWADAVAVRRMRDEYKKLGGDPREIKLNSDTPVNPELLDAIDQIRKICPSIGVITVLFDSDGLPVEEKAAFEKSAGGVVSVGGIDWEHCESNRKGSFVSANPQVTHFGYVLADALRRQMGTRAAVSTQFCQYEKSNAAVWVKRGLDDMLVNEPYPDHTAKWLHKKLTNAFKLWELVGNVSLFGASVDPDTLNKDSGTSVEVAFAEMLDGNRVGNADDELLYEWAETHWEQVGHPQIRKAATEFIRSFYRAAHRTGDAVKMAIDAGHLYRIPDPQIRYGLGGAVLPFSDMTVVIDDDGNIAARAPAKADGIRYCVNAKWTDRDQPCPIFMKFIHEVLPDDDVRLLVQKYIGYTLLGDNRHAVAQWWFGSGANGKSVLAEIVGALHRKVASANLENLGGFQSEGLLDASLITVDETPRRIDEQRLKIAISGGEMQIDRKNRPSVTVKLRAKWLLRGNDRPALSDQSDGLWRRLHVIHFEQKFDGDKRDDLLLQKMLENELSGIAWWALQGLCIVLRDKGFKNIPDKVLAWKREMQTETDSVYSWWDDEDVRVSEKATEIKDDVYGAYRSWCIKNGAATLGAPRFWQRVKSIVDRNGQVMPATRGQGTTVDDRTGQKKVVRVHRVGLRFGIDTSSADSDRPADVVPMRSVYSGRK